MTQISVTYLKTLKQKSMGLIGKKNPYAVYFSTRWGIHTFGVRFPIDILILDRDFRVVKATSHVPPNSIYVWNPKHYHVVELPEGEIQKQKITIEQKITLLYS
jgi:uncharacterized membrane protein (UPF0127 family)